MELRPYQQEAVDAVYNFLRRTDSNPCVVLPVGTGKTLVLAQIVQDAVKRWNGRVLILAHVKELLEQNADKIQKLCPDLKIGIYSAGLKSRDTEEKAIVAGIQSVYNRASELGSFDLVIVDEAHLIPPDGDGMYRTLLTALKEITPHLRVIGLTATPFRLKGGLICQPENILNEVCYEANLKDMIAQGYLTPLVARAGKTEANLDNLHIRGGEFVEEEVAQAMDQDELVSAACHEIVELTRERKAVLIFTANVAHCQHVAQKIASIAGQECAIVTGTTPSNERAELIERFKGKAIPTDLLGNAKPPLKFLCNVNVLTTGFDAPCTDCVVLLRPTNSPGLLVQMVGRGTRLSPETEKKDCLVLDFGKNIQRLGTLDNITVKNHMGRRFGVGESEKSAPAKVCPKCNALIHAVFQTCPHCGYEYPPPEVRITKHASTENVISGSEIKKYTVGTVYYSVHEKKFAPPGTPMTMRIDYEIGPQQYQSEWVCPEHTGYAREKFERWWQRRAAIVCPAPPTAQIAVNYACEGVLATTKSITVKKNAGEPYGRIIRYELGERPVFREPGEDLDELPVSPPGTPCDLSDIPF